MRVIMTTANFSPAVECRRAKCDGDFRIPTLLDWGDGGLALPARYSSAEGRLYKRNV